MIQARPWCKGGLDDGCGLERELVAVPRPFDSVVRLGVI
jgi:hypothetical protein